MFRFGLGIRRVVTTAVQALFTPIPEITVTGGYSRRAQVLHDLSVEYENAEPVVTIQPSLLVEIQREGQVLTIQNTGPVIG